MLLYIIIFVLDDINLTLLYSFALTNLHFLQKISMNDVLKKILSTNNIQLAITYSKNRSLLCHTNMSSCLYIKTFFVSMFFRYICHYIYQKKTDYCYCKDFSDQLNSEDKDNILQCSIQDGRLNSP